MLISSAYLMCGQRVVVVDTGIPGSGGRVLRLLRKIGRQPNDVSLILLTHGHLDHFGAALELREATGAPVAIHPLDGHALRAGRNPPLVPRGLAGRMMRPFFQHQQIAPLEPDILIEAGNSLRPFGIDAEVIHTPGHTPGSISVLHASGDLIAGDLLIGGYLGGHVLRSRPRLPYFLDDLAQLRASVMRMCELQITRVHVGHGGPIAAASLASWLRHNTGKVETNSDLP